VTLRVSRRRRTEEQLRDLLEQCRGDALTYSPVGVSLTAATPHHLERRRWQTTLAEPVGFERAVAAVRDWKIHRGAGISVVADGPLVVGTNVAMSAPLPIGYVDAACRIVAVVEEPDRFGFAYGTLPVHPEQGEESFLLHRDPPTFTVEAVSRPAGRFARAVPLVPHRLQAAAARRYLTAMLAALT
jgi:uncharacterized protein (UPF0548 family)